jgi:hypothetical protein
MANIEQVREKVVESLSDLPSDKVKEVLNFVEYLKIRESKDFIDYVNRRTKKALEARKKGNHFVSIQELRAEYK